MARTEVTVTQLSRAGVRGTGVAGTADGLKVRNDGRTWLEITNAANASRVVTVLTGQQILQLDVADLSVTVPALETRMVGLLPPDTFNQAVEAGMVYIDLPEGDEADLTVRAYRT